MNRTALVLADGTVYYGMGFGAPAPRIDQLNEDSASSRTPLHDVGEVVFNTAMSGYGEVLTDPSYTGQIVVMTYPHIGNYGIDETWSETGPEEGRSGTARPIKPAGIVVRSLYTGPVPTGRIKLAEYLERNGIPGVTDLDTRRLTLDIRDRGSRNGILCRPSRGETLTDEETKRAVTFLLDFPAMEGRGLIDEVGATKPVTLPGGSGPHLALYDCGIKANIIRELQRLGCTLTLMPSTATAAEIRATGAKAVMLSNGPGDPAVLKHQVNQTRELMGHLPVLGICLGHQIIAEAAGARTYKMKFGHHGVNHPVREEIPPHRAATDSGENRTTGNGAAAAAAEQPPAQGPFKGRVFVTSQNHGFSVEESTLPEGMRVWFRNANDNTVEGLWDDSRRIRSTQFHPESAPGPTDSRWIFSAFLEVI